MVKLANQQPLVGPTAGASGGGSGLRMTDERHKLTVSHAPTRARVAACAVRPAAGSLDLSIADPAGLTGAERVEVLRRHALRALQAMAAAGEVRVRLVGDSEMSGAHARYMNDASTTDVLTFDLTEGASAPAEPGGQGEPLDVDILICVDEARRQAARRGHELECELLLYIVHGVLHCVGYDDLSAEGAARMHAEEDRILSVIGIGPTYGRPESPAPDADEARQEVR